MGFRFPVFIKVFRTICMKKIIFQKGVDYLGNLWENIRYGILGEI